MSLVPRFFDDLDLVDPFTWDPWRFHRSSLDHHFGLGIHPRQLRDMLAAPQRLRQRMAEMQQELGAVQTLGKDGFQVSLDVQQFKPNEITVKQVDNTVVVEGKHEERQDEHGFISRHFTRKYVLPKEINAQQLSSALSSDGILTLKAPTLAPAIDEKRERVVQIQQTGPARNSIKANPGGDKEKKPE